MSSRLKRYLLEMYESRRSLLLQQSSDSAFPIQIDDQDDNDRIDEFCTIFCMVGKNDTFTLEFAGNFPITAGMVDLAEIYGGYASREQGRLSITISVHQIEALMDLARRIKKTSFSGDAINNPNWLSVSARTISSLYRFVRIIKAYMHTADDKSLPSPAIPVVG